MNKFYFVQQDHQGRRAFLNASLISMKAKLLLGCGPPPTLQNCFSRANAKITTPGLRE